MPLVQIEHRADNFLVGLTNNPPSTMPPTTNAYTTCGQWPGSAPASATMFVKCTDNLQSARYVVIIQQYQPRAFLAICELEVYGRGKRFVIDVHDTLACAKGGCYSG
jgi:hypothetical protein